MTRIVAGSMGGRRLAAPPGSRTRPTSDRVREGLFNTLQSVTELAGSRFADLYAGSGAVGLEACSRGASTVLLIESDPAAARTARANIASLGVGDSVRLVVGDVLAVVGSAAAPATTVAPVTPATTVAPVTTVTPASPAPSYDVVFADPPYALADAKLTALQEALRDGGWLAPGGVLVIERATRSGPVRWVDPVTELRTRRYGETTLWYGRRP